MTPGTVIAARYRIVRRIDAGAMGAVYEALDTQTERRRALKVMHPHTLERADLRERFTLEARIAGQVESAALVDVLDAGVDEATGTPFLVMELLRGETLGRRLERVGRHPPAEVLLYLAQAASGIDKMHRLGIVHRDLKPSNLFLEQREDGAPRIKILDFGVAKVVHEGAARGSTSAAGTPIYMAPEQFHGGAVTPSADLHALGMIAFTLLVGVPYWKEESERGDGPIAFALIAIRGPGEPARARAARLDPGGPPAALPAAFDPWFARATSLDPRRRFPSACAAVEALAGALGVDGYALPEPQVAAGDPEAPPRSAAEQSTLTGASSGVARQNGSGEAGYSLSRGGDGAGVPLAETRPAPPGSALERDAPVPVPVPLPLPVPLPVDDTPRPRNDNPPPEASVSFRRSRWPRRLAVACGALAAFGVGTAFLRRGAPPAASSPSSTILTSPTLAAASPAGLARGSPLDAADAVLACPILEASGVDAPTGWLGAAAAATFCERARVVLGGGTARTLIPAELLSLPRSPADRVPVDPYAAPEARARSLEAARRRGAAYVDGSVVREPSGFRLAITLRAADGSELARAGGAGRALFEAARGAMVPLIAAGQLPKAPRLDPAVAGFSRARSVDAALDLLDLTMAMIHNAGGLPDACARVEARSGELAEMGPGERFRCAYTLGQRAAEGEVPPAAAADSGSASASASGSGSAPASGSGSGSASASASAPGSAPASAPGSAPASASAADSPGAFAARARIALMVHRVADPREAAELQRLYEREPSPWGRSTLAATASCLLQSSDARRAAEMALLAVQAEPKNPTGEWCAPWVQLATVTRGTPSAESSLRAMQAWAPWDAYGWLLEAIGPGDPARALAFARRAYVLSPFDAYVADVLVDRLLGTGAREEARGVALALPAGGYAPHRVESELLLVRIEASEGRFAAALERAERAMEISAGDAGWVRVQRLQIAWRALELGLVLGRAAEVADLIVARFLDPEPAPLEGSHLDVPLRIPAICAYASKAVSPRCFRRFAALRTHLTEGILPNTGAFAAGAERYAEGDFRGAARAWRPLLRDPGPFIEVLADAMVATYERLGEDDIVDRLESAAQDTSASLNGASPATVRAARRAAARGQQTEARALARRVVEAWSAADAQVPAVGAMRRLAAGLPE